MRFTRRGALGLGLGLGVGAATGPLTGCSGESKEISIGYFPVVSPVPIMQKQAMLADLGYEVNWVKIDQGLPGAATALAAGRLDMTWGNSASALVIFSTTAEAAKLVSQSFVNENITVVATDSGLDDPSKITDKKVVVSGPKTASTLFFEIGLKKAGVDPSTNEYFVSGTGPGMVGVLDSGGAEVAATYVPYAADMVLKEIGTVLFSASDALGTDAPGDGFIASSSFCDKNPEAVQAVLRAQFEATDLINSDPDQAMQQMAEFAGVSVDSVSYSFEHDLVGVAKNYAPDEDGLGQVAQLAQDLGYAPDKSVDLPSFLPDFVDSSFAEGARS